MGDLTVIGKYVFELKIGRGFLFAFVKQYPNNNWNCKMHILAFSVVTVDWVCEYCGDSGIYNNSFSCSDCSDCWSVLQRILESTQAVQALSRIYTLHRFSSSLVECLNHHWTVAKLVRKNIHAEFILSIEANSCNGDFIVYTG